MAIGHIVAEIRQFFSFQNGQLPSSCMLNVSNLLLCWNILLFSDLR